MMVMEKREKIKKSHSVRVSIIISLAKNDEAKTKARTSASRRCIVVPLLDGEDRSGEEEEEGGEEDGCPGHRRDGADRRPSQPPAG
jgi:hypothetical protein